MNNRCSMLSRRFESDSACGREGNSGRRFRYNTQRWRVEGVDDFEVYSAEYNNI